MSLSVSVAMCTYNGEAYLPMQLASIAAQERAPQELVVCDDGSSDGSLELVKAFARRAPFPVRTFRNDINLGSTKNFENAIRLCEGELIALCDQDDVWKSNKICRLAKVLEQDASIGGVFSDAELMDSNSARTGKRLWQLHHFVMKRPDHFDRDAAVALLLKHDVVTGATLMFRSSLRRMLTPISDLWVHDGWIAWMLVLNSRLSFVEEPLVEYRIHARQQFGVGHLNWIDKLKDSHPETRQKLKAMAEQFNALRHDLPVCSEKEIARYSQMIDEKISFLRRRSELPLNFLLRAYFILGSLPSYRRYARGTSSMGGDLFIPPSSGNGKGAM